MSAGEPSRPEIVETMLDPGLYPDLEGEVELRETHASWVFLVGGMAYKVKKPVSLPFLDYGTLERRLEMCREEVRLNRRLAPSYYLGVRSIAARSGGEVELAADDDPDAIEYAVEMRGVPEQLTLEALSQRHELSSGPVDAVAERLSAFHRDEAPGVAEPERAVEALARSLEENHETLAEVGPPVLDRPALDAAAAFTRTLLGACRPELERRAGEGMVRECHGDLRAEHVIATDPVEVYDCIEFDPALREIDVGSDLAFLVMDLHRLGEAAAAQRLVDRYRAEGGDPGSDRLLALLASYRAWIRAKVACIGLHDAGAERAEGLGERARELFAVGRRFAWSARRPFVLVVCGLAASGKSTIADAVVEASGLPVVGTDPVRKELAGVAPTERAPGSAYTGEFSRSTYEEVGRRAAAAFAASGGVVVDGTCRRRSERRALASGLSGEAAEVPLLWARCEAPDAVLLERAGARADDPARVSDADEDVVAGQLGSFEPLDEATEGRAATIDTAGEPAEALAAVERLADAAAAG